MTVAVDDVCYRASAMIERWILRFGVVMAASAPFVVGACGSNGGRAGRARTSAKVSAEDRALEGAWSEPSATEAPPQAAPPPATTPPEASSGAGPAASAAPAPAPRARPACPLSCTVAHRGPIGAAEEARFTAALADVTSTLHDCASGPIPSMTLRFGSQGALTHFGVEEEAGGSDPRCIDAVRSARPPIQFAGPSTVRCAERCPRDGDARSR